MIFVLFKCFPESRESSMFRNLGSGVIERDGSGEYFKFFELIVSVVGDIFCVYLLKESGIFFNASSFFDECFFSVDLFDLFWFKVFLGLEFCDFCEFFVDVTDLLLESPEERFILLVYDFYFIFVVFSFLWLWFF